MAASHFAIPHICADILASLARGEFHPFKHFDTCRNITRVTLFTSVYGECLQSLVFLAHYTHTGKRATFLLAMYVDPAHRERGLGKAALARVAEYLQTNALPCFVPLQSCIFRAVGRPEYAGLLRSCGFCVGPDCIFREVC